MRKILFFLLPVVILLSCQKQQAFKYDQKKFKQLRNKITALPTQERLQKWDSLLALDEFTPIQMAYIHFDKGNDYSYRSEENEAIKQYNEALNTFVNSNEELMIAKTLINLGISYAFLNKKSTATDYVIKGLNIAVDLEHQETISRAYSELAHIYYLYGDKKTAIEYLEKTGKIQKSLQDSLGMSATYNNISILYKEMDKVPESYEYAFKSLQLDEILGNDFALINSYNNLGALTYLYKKDKKETLYYYNKALSLLKKHQLNDPSVFENLGDLYKDINRPDSALYYYQKALLPPNQNYENKVRLYDKILYLTLDSNGNMDAINILKKRDSVAALQRKLQKEENKNNIKSNMILLANQQQLEQAKQLNKKNRIIFIFILVIFILGILISYQLNRFDKLRYKQEKFILEQKVLRSQMSPHFIFNVLSSIQNSLIENNPIKSATYLSKFAHLIRQNFDYVQRRYISLKEELDILKNYLDTQKFRYKDKFDYSIEVADEIEQASIQIPPMILQPFVENAIEHGFKNIDYKGQLTIKVYPKNNKICFTIIDNGVGFKPKDDGKEHALDIFKRRLEIMGKEELDSFKIENLAKGTRVAFCFSKKFIKNKNLV